MIARLKAWAQEVRRDVEALWLAARDPRVPLPAKLLAGLVAAYALSPIDLIPDFIPILGLLDDAILVPLGIMLVMKLVPAPLMAELRAEAAAHPARPASWLGAGLVVVLWLGALAFLLRFW